MLERIRTYFKKEYTKLSDAERKHGKSSASSKAGKLLILFFVVMFIFTVISRAAEAVTQASVKVTSPRADRLIFQVTGTGAVALAEEEYLNVIPGYRIDKVNVSSGEPVGKDTVLFRYNEEDLKSRSSSIETDIARLKLQIQLEQLNVVSAEAEASQAPKLSLKQAEDNLKTAKQRLTEAEAEYQDNVSKTKKELLQDKKEEYAEALKKYETTLNLQDKQLKLSFRTLEDAKTAYAQANELTDQIKQFTDDYITAVIKGDSLAMHNAKEAIFETFYGSKEAYEEHQDAVFSAALDMDWDDEDLSLLQYLITHFGAMMKEMREELQIAENSTDPFISSAEHIRQLNEKYEFAKQSYLKNIDDYQAQLTLMSNSLSPSATELKKLRRDDIKLENCLTSLKKSAKEVSDGKVEKELSDLLLGERAKPIEKDIAAKKLALDRAEEDYETLKKENETANSELLAELKELDTEIISMEKGTYDYEEALEGKEQAVAAAKEAVRMEEQAVELSKLQYDNAVLSDTERVELTEKKNQSTGLVVQGYELELQSKETELSEVRKLLEHSGEVVSPYEGIVTSIDLEAGKIATGGELIKIGTGDYVYRAEFDGKMAGYAEAGGKIAITLAGEKSSIEAEISTVSLNETGKAVLTAALPEQAYILGESAEFKIMMESDRFDLCIPIQALREDNFGNYVYITREQDTILGTELIADRVNVEVLEKNNSTAAVEGPLSPKDSVITDSSKFISNADKVRVK